MPEELGRYECLEFGALLLRLMPLVIFSIPMSAATACTLDTVPNWHGYYAEGWPETAQTITPPVQCPKIIEYAFELSPRNSPGKIVFSIYEWSHFGPVGSALFSQPCDGASGRIIRLSSQ